MKKGCTAVLPLLLILLSAGAGTAAPADINDDSDQKPKQVVVTATKLETPEEQVGSSITVITSDQIEKMQKTLVRDVLKSVPALDVVSNGYLGGVTSVFIRGAKSEHTLVFIDGVEMNDPMATGGGFDFAHLTTDNIDRIEVLRGPQSTLYGADAIGGVINIITKRGKEGTSGFASLEGGSFNSFRGAAGGSGGNEWMQYSIGFSRTDTDGISSAEEADGNTETDPYKNTSVYGTLGVAPAESLDLDFTMRFIDTESSLDNFSGPGGDDPNYRTDGQQVFFRSQGTAYFFDDIWETKLGFSLMNYSRYSRNDTDEDHPDDSSKSTFDAQTLKFDWQNNFYFHDTNTMTFGIDTDKATGSSTYDSESPYGRYSSVFAEQSMRTTGYYLQDQIALWNAWFTTVGIRWDDNSIFGTETTYRIASAYQVYGTGIRIKGSFGTGFKAPTLYQLYSDYGDLNLAPEESTGWDFGLEQSLLKDKAVIGATIFRNDFDNMIDFDLDTWTYVNIARADTRGLELSASARATDALDFRFSYTYMRTKDLDTGAVLVRRPKHKLHFNLNYNFLNESNVNLEIIYVGHRYDNYGVDLDGYVVVNPAASYRISRSVELFGRLENLFDRQYQEADGYGTPGISVYGGIKVLFNGI